MADLLFVLRGTTSWHVFSSDWRAIMRVIRPQSQSWLSLAYASGVYGWLSTLHSSEPEGQRLPLIRRSISSRKRYGSWR